MIKEETVATVRPDVVPAYCEVEIFVFTLLFTVPEGFCGKVEIPVT